MKSNPENSHKATSYRFNAKEYDAETGNYYYGARYYDPKFSIWLSVDPLAGEFPHLTPYNFTENNPINLIDPDGLSAIPVSDLGAWHGDPAQRAEEALGRMENNPVMYANDGGTEPPSAKQSNETSSPLMSGRENLLTSGNSDNGLEFNVVKKFLKNTGDYAGYGEAAAGALQIGMSEYRSSLSISSKIGTFSRGKIECDSRMIRKG